MIILGGGIAGLMAALAAAPAPVTLLNPSALGEEAASTWSQGGLAAAIGEDDSVDLHIADTIAAGAGLCNRAVVSQVVKAGPEFVEMLLAYGVRFDRDAARNLARGLEAAHSRPRILHAGGDQTGTEIMRALIGAICNTPSITILYAKARHIFVGDDGVTGVLASAGREVFRLPTHCVLLATGGIGGLFRYTTNPPGAIGHGLMLAAQAGAKLANLEFVQFHPTALDTKGPFQPLISEAVRGEGATLIDEMGHAFMNGADLAARDVVARAVFAHQEEGHRVFLDTRFMGASFATRFPTINASCVRAGIDPQTQPIPVRPAAHYHMGGVAVDARGQTSVDRLFAAGEVACTGMHGANRLASNSLLEAAIYGTAAGKAMADLPVKRRRTLREISAPPTPDAEPVRDIMSAHVGVVRDARGLTRAIAELSALTPENEAAQLGLRIAQAALAGSVSIGAHTRRDAPGLLHQVA